MIPRLVIAGLWAGMIPVISAAQGVAADSARAATRAATRIAVERHVRSLAADSLNGRVGGTAGAAIAAHYLATALGEAKALPGVPTTTCDAAGKCEWTYFQPVRGRRIAAPEAYDIARNIVAMVPGSDTALADQWVIVGAHTDTYSYNGYGNVTSRNVAVPGADDNASGMATLIELARRIAAEPLRRPVIFLLYDEIAGGSDSFLEGVQRPEQSMVAMFNLEMVGRLNAGRLEVRGTSTSRSWRPIIDSAAAGTGMRVTPSSDARRRDPFVERGVPVLLLTTGFHSDGTGPRDNVNRIDYDGLVRVVEFTERLIRLTGNGIRPWRAR